MQENKRYGDRELDNNNTLGNKRILWIWQAEAVLVWQILSNVCTK
jgi:hypothetical protein